MATLYKIDKDGNETTETVQPVDAAAGFELDQLYKLVDCGTIEIIPAGPGKIAVIDENGKLTGKPLNFKATHVVVKGLRELGRTLAPGDPGIVGNALICNDDEVK